MTANDNCPLPIPDLDGLLMLLPPFKHTPIVCWGTQSYWLIIGPGAEVLADYMNVQCHKDIRGFTWIVVSRDGFPPRNFGMSRFNRQLSNQFIFVG